MACALVLQMFYSVLWPQIAAPAVAAMLFLFMFDMLSCSWCTIVVSFVITQKETHVNWCNTRQDVCSSNSISQEDTDLLINSE